MERPSAARSSLQTKAGFKKSCALLRSKKDCAGALILRDQLAMTRLIDLSFVRQSGMPSFGTQERALRFLAAPGLTRVYYPAPADMGGES